MDYQIPMSNWIFVKDFETYDQTRAWFVYFRKEFTLDVLPESLVLKLSADSRYKLFVNGRLAETGPVKGDGFTWYEDRVDIAPYLQTGANVLAVEVLRYPRIHRLGNHGVWRTELPGLYVREEGETYGLSADASWKYALPDITIRTESIYFAPLMILEDVVGTASLQGWRLAGYDDGAWEAAVPYYLPLVSQAVSPGRLSPRPIPSLTRDFKQFEGVRYLREGETDPAAWEDMLKGRGTVSVPAHAKVTVEIDAGCEETGYLSLRFAEGKGTKFSLECAEAYFICENGKPTARKGDRTDAENGLLQGYTDTYLAAGSGRDGAPECYEPYWFRTFRYIGVTVETGDEPVTITGLDYLETGYPLQAAGHVTTSDKTLDPVWDISLRTLRRCMHETYEDCPFYEQLQYAMDSRSQILYTYNVSADDRLARKCMDDFRRSQRPDGMLNCSYPNYGPNIIPGFSIYYIGMLHDHMEYFGDREFLRRHMGCVDGILEFFRRNLTSEGIVGKTGGPNGWGPYWSFVDWTDQWDDLSGTPRATLQGPITMESLLYIYGLTMAADVLRFLGRPGVADEYLARAGEVRKAIRAACLDDKGMLMDGPGFAEYSVHCQVFGILTDTLTVEEGTRDLLEALSDSRKYAQSSVAFAFYLFRAMEKIGRYDLTDAQWDLWRDMVKNKLTTCVEDGVRGRSDCHAWGALLLHELPAVVLGVRPGKPGFAEIRIHPVPGVLTLAEGLVPTAAGNVSVAWKKRDDGSLDITYEAPEGIPVRIE